MSEMVDRVAQAIAWANGDNDAKLYTADARAAIKAMRQPSGRMTLRVMNQLLVNDFVKNPLNYVMTFWELMIDEAQK